MRCQINSRLSISKNLLWGVVLGTVLGATATAHAASVGLKASTLGAGVELAVPLSEGFVGRLDFNDYSYDTSVTEGGIRYRANLQWRSTGAFVDWHPFGGAFRFCVGYLANGNRIDAQANGTQTIGTTTYTNVDLRGTVDFNSGGYVGIGWGNAASKGWTFLADLGLLYQGTPHVSLVDRTGTVSSSDLRKQEADAESNLKDLAHYPVASIGFAYRF